MAPRLALPFVLVALAGCRQESPEAALQKAFDAALKAIQQGDAGTAAELLGPAFSGPDGMTGGEAKLFLTALLRREKVGVTVLSNRLAVEENQATQSVEVLLTSRAGGAFLPEDASRKPFLLTWERVEGRWRLQGLQEVR